MRIAVNDGPVFSSPRAIQFGLVDFRDFPLLMLVHGGDRSRSYVFVTSVNVKGMCHLSIPPGRIDGNATDSRTSIEILESRDVL